MRRWLVLIPFIAFVAVLSCTSDPSAEKPNIVLIVADDLGYGELGCYGQEYIKTPNIDRLASEGMRFTQFYSGSPVCAPSRCVLMTGKHPGHAYIRDNGNPKGRDLDQDAGIFPGQHPIPDAAVTMAELLKEAGYATGAMGKWGLGYEGSTGDPNQQGFDLFYGYLCQIHAHNHYPRFLWKNGEKELLAGNDRTLKGEQYSQNLFVKEAGQFIRDNAANPFFLYLPFAVPHLSIQVPDESVLEYRQQIPEAEYVHRGYLPHPFPRAGYAAMVTHMDRGIGEILDLLDSLQIADNTLVIFTSDNGPTYDRLGGSDSEFFNSAAGFRGLKGSIYEGGIRVPLVVRWPGRVTEGTESDHIAAFWDILPTLLDASGIDTDYRSDGISLVPALTGHPQPEHEFLYWEFPSYSGQVAVRMGKWKGVVRNLQAENGDTSFQLYDLETDPSETRNVASEHPAMVERMKSVMRAEHMHSELFPFPEYEEYLSR